ncbi:MAG: COX15/CtaA family protein [Burkholderiaceae bacterium]
MTPTSLLWLVLIGIAVAAAPLVYVWRSGDVQKYRKLAWITAFLTLDLIMVGSFTRLTDSGLGCPDWPGCYGQSNPWSAGDQIRQAQDALPTGPVTMSKAWIEMVHRYFALAVGVLIVVLAAQAWRRSQAHGSSKRSPWWATSALVWVCIQGLFGALTVTMKLQPAIVTLHLLGGVGLLAILTWIALREAPTDSSIAAPRAHAMAVVALSVVFVQIALGGWVSSNYAVMACPDFPFCQGELVPAMNFSDGFTWWRALGQTGDGELIQVQALVAIHWTHRMFAFAVMASVGALIWQLWRSGFETLGKGLLGLLILQLLTGLSNVVLQWPLLLAVLHSGGAALLVAVLVVAVQRTSRRSLNLRAVQVSA